MSLLTDSYGALWRRRGRALAGQDCAPARESAGAPAGRRPGRVLLVEDDPVCARFAMHVLGTHGGFQVTHAAEPLAVLSQDPAGFWDLVLLGTDSDAAGARLLTALRGLAPDIPVAVITRNAPADGRAPEGADALVRKPILPERLVAVATSLVAGGRAT